MIIAMASAGRRQSEPGSYRGSLRYPLPSPNRQHYQNESESRNFQYFAGTQSTQIQTHQERDWDSHRNGKHAPGTSLQRIHHNQRADGEQDHDNADNRDVGDEPANAADFLARHFGERLSIPSNREQQR